MLPSPKKLFPLNVTLGSISILLINVNDEFLSNLIDLSPKYNSISD
jgi:hypothetical protein